MISWMIFYILAIPAFSFFLPLYSFWKMDDFSWGQTRVVLRESGKRIIVHVCVLRFSLLQRRLAMLSGWRKIRSSFYTPQISEWLCQLFVIYLFYISNVSIQENELWDKESNHSIGSWVGQKRRIRGITDSIFIRSRDILRKFSHQYPGLPNSECILLLDTSLVAIRLNRLSTQWRKLRRCSNHRYRSLFPTWTWSMLYRMSCVRLISIL